MNTILRSKLFIFLAACLSLVILITSFHGFTGLLASYNGSNLTPEAKLLSGLIPEASAFTDQGGVVSTDIFRNKNSWPRSDGYYGQKPNDYLPMALRSLATNTSAPGTRYPQYEYHNLVDVNGDALPDIVYARYNYSSESYAILLNKGNMGFEPTYRCHIGYKNYAPYYYYGDCSNK